jgi:hypothetical protein
VVVLHWRGGEVRRRSEPEHETTSDKRQETW